MSQKIGMVSLGCAKNQVNSEQMLYQLHTGGYEITTNVENTDAVIVNTCGFIESAKSEAIAEILELAALKDEGKIGKIIVTGCLAQRYADELRTELPEVDAVVGCGSYHEIVDVVEETLAGGNPVAMGDINAELPEISRVLTTPEYYAYLKIAEGCDNRCSYCVIPSLRGKYRSRRMEEIVQEAKDLAQMGVKELIVVAQDTSRYGLDLYGERKLAELLGQLCAIGGIRWVRVHYMYPDEISDELIDVLATEEKIVKYLDIPIQHANDKILKAMNRRGNKDVLESLFTKLRQRIPGLVLRTSLICGLPGEGEEEFEELCDFLRKHRLERVGVFAFSPEEGTPAAEMEPGCDSEEAMRRVDIITDIQSRIMDDYNDARMDTVMEVICEGFDRYAECYFGRTYADSPDVDGKVFFTSGVKLYEGQFVNVLITDTLDGDLVGEALIDEEELED